MNKIIIDGYNLIHRVPELAKILEVSLEQARDELIRLIKRYLLSKQVEIIVVFDGNHSQIGIENAHQTRKLKIVFSKYPFKADPMIKNLIGNESNKKSLTIVTDDSDIIQFAKANKTRVSASADFHNLLVKRFQSPEIYNKYDRELSDEELTEWLKLFGENESRE